MRTIWITGASGGIGNAVARLFAAEGNRIALGYCRGAENIELLARSLRAAGAEALPVQADVSDSASVAQAYEAIERAFGGVDVLVCCAGVAQQKLLTDVTDDDWARMMGVNVTGTFLCCRAVIPHMVREKRGSIITVSSVWGVCGASCEAHYSASKAAVIGLTKALAKELGPSGIRVNCVAPGVIDTPMNAGFDPETMESLREETPLGRIGRPEDAAKAVRFLADSDADFMTGQVLCVDGGFIL